MFGPFELLYPSRQPPAQFPSSPSTFMKPLFLFLLLLYFVDAVVELDTLPDSNDLVLWVPRADARDDSELYVYLQRPNARASTQIEIRRVSKCSYKEHRPAFIMSDGQEPMCVFNEVPTLSRQRWLSRDPNFRVEVSHVETPLSVFTSVLDAFTVTTAFEMMTLSHFGNVTTWTDALVTALVDHKYSARDIDFGGDVDMETLLRFIREANVSVLEFRFSIPILSDYFFREPAVKRLAAISFTNAKRNEISDESLAELGATILRLGNAPRVTLDGIRAFLEPVIERHKQRAELKLKPAFKVDPDQILAGLEAEEQQPWKDSWRERRSWKIAISASNVLDFHIMHENEYVTFTLVNSPNEEEEEPYKQKKTE